MESVTHSRDGLVEGGYGVGIDVDVDDPRTLLGGVGGLDGADGQLGVPRAVTVRAVRAILDQLDLLLDTVGDERDPERLTMTVREDPVLHLEVARKALDLTLGEIGRCFYHTT